MLRCFGGLRRSQGPAPWIWCRHKGTDRSAGPTAPLPDPQGLSTPTSIFGDPKPGSSGSRLITDPPLTRPAWTTDQGTGRRSYFSKFASVGKILQGSRSEEDERVLQKWKEKKIRELGQDGFERYKQELFGRGHALHDSINTYLTQSPPTDPPPVPTGVEGLWASVEHVLGNIMNVKSSECAVEHKLLGYSGVADCIAEYKGKLYLIDWKTSERRKRSLCDCYDQPVQIAAYIGAVNNDYNLPFSVERGLLVICYDTGMKADVHQLDSEILLHYWSVWQQRLHTYNISQQQ